MNSVFADTHYWIATVNPNDPYRAAAEEARRGLGPCVLVTTDEVLGEFLAAFSKYGSMLRRKATQTVRAILNNPNVKVIPQSRDTFLRALERYSAREDKEYSLVDCSSMNAMDQQALRDVLTNDHHFEQEGYNVLISLGQRGRQR